MPVFTGMTGMLILKPLSDEYNQAGNF